MKHTITTRVAMHTTLDVIGYAQKQRLITKEQTRAHIFDYQSFVIQQILYFNHKKSTSISETNYMRIEKAIYYILKHAAHIPLYMQLAEHTIQELYDKGIRCLKMEVAHLTQNVRRLQRQQLNFPNERYQDVVYAQLPQYLEILKTYDAPFHYYHTRMDLDYPLIDGIPLFFNMYYRDGVDLIKEYVRRLTIEQAFCTRFSTTLPTFFQQYETFHGISVNDIHINLFEILFYQCLANLILYEKEEILLVEQDIVKLKQVFASQELLQIAIQHIHCFISKLDEPLQAYIDLHSQGMQQEWEKFLHQDYQLLVYKLEEVQHIHSTLPPSSIHFMKYLHTLDTYTKLTDKLQYIKDQQISIYDMFDLLDHDILMEQEYIFYFRTLCTMDIALILKLLVPHSTAFHHSMTLDQLLDEFECEHLWQMAWKKYVRSLPLSKKLEIKAYIDRLVLS